jgi:hypothetical protein
MNCGPYGFQQIRIQEHMAAGLRTGKRQRLVDELVNDKSLARISGTGLGEVLFTEFRLNPTKTFGVVKRAFR